MIRKPIIQDSGMLQQMQHSDELDIPLEARFQKLQRQFRLLILFMVDQGYELTEELTDDLELLDQSKGKQKC